MSTHEVPSVGDDPLDALELSEVLDYVVCWLLDAGAEVEASLDHHADDTGTAEWLREELARWSECLERRTPRW
jgi:capsid portal protein